MAARAAAADGLVTRTLESILDPVFPDPIRDGSSRRMPGEYSTIAWQCDHGPEIIS